jgi:beta-galactosidase
MKVPSSPITVPENTSPVFPVNLDMNGVTLRYSTARLMARVEDNGIPCFVFCEEKGIKPEFQFAAENKVKTSSLSKQYGSAVSYYPRPSRGFAMTVTAGGEEKAHVILLSRQDAECAWRLNFAGKPRLLISNANVIIDSGKMELSSANAFMNLTIFPRIKKLF